MQKEEKRLKVLHLISGGDTGGAKTHISALLKGLNKMIDASIICFIEDTFYEDLHKAGVPIKVFEQKSRSDLSVIKRLTDEIEREDYDIIHCHGARANFIALFIKHKVKKPFVTTIHSDYKLDFKDNFYKRFVYTTLNQVALKMFDYYIGVSHQFRDMLIDRGFKRDRIFVTYNGIDPYSTEEHLDKKRFLERHGIKYNGEVIVGILARLDEIKDHHTFIEAAKFVLEEEDAMFLIAGEGANEEYLKELVKKYGLEDKIKFIGFIKDPYSFLNTIDINTLTSLSESFPYVILEGAKMKKPIVTTEVGGINRLVIDGDNGFLVPVGNVGVLKDRLLTLIRNSEIRKAMGEKLFKAVEDKYSYEAMARSHIEIYNNILNNGPAILMSGYFGFDNSGDDAILTAIVKDILDFRPDARVKVLSRDPNKTEDLCNVSAANRFKIRDIIRSLKATDILVSGGGSLLQDVTSTRSLLYYLALMKLAFFYKKPVMVYANGIGPVNKSFNRRLVKRVLNRVDFITLRDEDSRKCLEDMGVKNRNIQVTADPVFTLQAAPAERVNIIFQDEGIDKDKPLVGISVRHWKNDELLVRELSKVIKYILENKDISVVLIPMHYPEDLKISQSILDKVDNLNCHLLQEKYNVEELMGIIGELKLMVAMRLHSLIYAATQITPMLGLVYDPKVDGLLKELEVPYKLSVDNISEKEFLKVFEDAWENLENTKKIIETKEKNLKLLAYNNIETIFKIVGK
ncbi:MAG: polysaccharide pyruvyl transferase CsaB [Gudongella sp.]|nr:polysaccharide pyruvyl transferase CsaB [Gudongella sp.]